MLAYVGSAVDLGTLVWIGDGGVVRTIRMDSGAVSSAVGTNLTTLHAVGSGLYGSMVLAGLSGGVSFVAHYSVQPFSGEVIEMVTAAPVPGNRSVVCASAYADAEVVLVTDDLHVYLWNATAGLSGQVVLVGALESDAQLVPTGAPSLRSTCAVAYHINGLGPNDLHKGLAYRSRAGVTGVRFFNLTSNSSSPFIPLEVPITCTDYSFAAQIYGPTFSAYLICSDVDSASVYFAVANYPNVTLLGFLPMSHVFPDMYGDGLNFFPFFIGVGNGKSSVFVQSRFGFDNVGAAASVSFAGAVGVAYVADYGTAPQTTSTTTTSSTSGDHGGGDDDSLSTGEIVLIVVGSVLVLVLLLLGLLLITVIAAFIIRSKNVSASYKPI